VAVNFFDESLIFYNGAFVISGTKISLYHSLFFNPKIEQLCQEVQVVAKAVAAAIQVEAEAEARVVNLKEV
jgi:hypothetical protein